ncbi:beta-lactamase family protein [Subsaxibacter sp. CAU 1640]|uniref:serine hydrolase domain-containing protein n=1 Tax=Subsaxibacter sp. CAU 1640 TaxID=2933271 RepID=UPI0020049328|nr:serine hydrolase domain-containing protein [Subsaxibacter sp. CAU 1640]MCK7591409.1 beta-lactamase family protein [Subsaxibacter sp. CAU 1640]
MRILILFVCGLAFLYSCKQAETNYPELQQPLSDLQLKKIDSVCDAFIKRGHTVGLSLGLSHNGNIIYSKGFGLANIASKTPATDSTIYAIASISKFITAITTLKLAEAGKLNLSDKVSKYVPLPKQDHMEDITIEHLLRHQSGLVDHEDYMDSIYINEKRIPTQKEFLNFIDQPLFFTPGTHYSYSNSGYALLSSILENIEQQSFDALIKTNISNPHQLHSIAMWPNNWHRDNASMSYEVVEKNIDTSFHMMTEGMKGDGGLSSTITDLLKLMDQLSAGDIISKASLDQMLSPTPIGKTSIDYGLGVKFGMYQDERTYGHSGGYKGIGWAIVAHYPDSGYTFAAAMNTNYSPDEVWLLRHYIMPIVLGIEPPDFNETNQVANANRYVGTYSDINRWGAGEGSVRIVTTSDGQLFWDNPKTETPGARLYQKNDSIFNWKPFPYDSYRFHFVNDSVVACSEYYDGMFGMVRMRK